MPHNLYLHSEVIQSRQWNLENEEVIKHQLKYEFVDTLLSMIIGWAINSAMILIAAATFFTNNVKITELGQAQSMLTPILGSTASSIFALALLFSGISSSVTASMAGGSIFAGMYKEPYDIHDRHSGMGVLTTILLALVIIFFITDPFKGLVVSQMLLSIQLPLTIILQIHLTSSKEVMGKYANSTRSKIVLWIIAAIVISLNILLLTTL
jgi:manganese transport protein